MIKGFLFEKSFVSELKLDTPKKDETLCAGLLLLMP